MSTWGFGAILDPYHISQLYISSQQDGGAGSSTVDLFGPESFLSGDRQFKKR